MELHRCIICGAPLEEIDTEQTLIKCKYCDHVNTRPKHYKNSRYSIANKLREEAEFDKAMAEYEKLLQEDEEDYTAHWGALLCKYGIEYVEDPSTGVVLPTCHLDRIRHESIQKEVHYIKAIEYAGEEVAEQYTQEAKQIDAIRADIMATMQNEDPYDVFICYKSKDKWKHRTEDSVWAQDIYEELEKRGYRVFFADKTIETGMKYEPVIFHALYSAKIMVVVGTKKEYLESRWVKNEWKRFMKLMKSSNRSIFPVYKDMSPDELPDELKPRQAKNLADVGAIQDLVSAVEKILKASKETKTAEVKFSEGISNQCKRLLQNGETFLKLEDYDAAEETYRTVTKEFPEEYRGWWGLIVCYTKNFKVMVDWQKMLAGECLVNKQLDTWFRYVKKLAPMDEFDEIERKYLDYAREISMILVPRYLREMSDKKSKICQNESQKKAEIENLQAEIRQCEDWYMDEEKKSDEEIGKYAEAVAAGEKTLRTGARIRTTAIHTGIGLVILGIGVLLFNSFHMWTLEACAVYLLVIDFFVFLACVNRVGDYRNSDSVMTEIERCNFQIEQWNQKKVNDQKKRDKLVGEKQALVKKLEEEILKSKADLWEIEEELARDPEDVKQERWEILRAAIQNI